MLDERGKPLIGSESSVRFDTFEEGPCPVLKALTSDVPSDTESAALAPWRNGYELSNLASRNVRLGSVQPRPLLRLFTRLREDLGR